MTVKQVLPGSDSTVISPPCFDTICLQIGSPIPRPNCTRPSLVVKWQVEDAVPRLRCHTLATVSDADAHLIGAGCVGLDPQLAVALHGLQSVGDQVRPILG